MHVYYYTLVASNLILIAVAEISKSMIHHLNCELGLIEDQFCPVDGGWTSWNSWSPCVGECGSMGKQTRNRHCTSPFPTKNGAPCLGSDKQIIPCQITGCSFNNYERMIQNNSERQTEIRTIKIFHEELPALAELCFSANCAFSVIENILGENAMTYWNTMNCIKYDIGCLIIGGWSDWTSFSPCTAPCGKGQKYRQRYCNNPTPSNLQLQCNGSPYQLRNCTGYSCHRELSGSWGLWSRWSPCRDGIQIKSRKCNENTNNEKTSCKGINQQIKDCKKMECSVTGGWSIWTSWTACSSECGVGTQSRNRVCNNPLPSGNGSLCMGSATDIRHCFNKPCSVKTHEVAVFSGQSILLYSPRKENFHLLHVYIRFLPSSPFGILCRRYEERNCIDSICDFVKIFLHNGKVLLMAQISQCTLVLVNDHKLEIGNWHEIFIVICGTYGTLRVDDKIHKTGYFSCTPKSTNLNHYMVIGKNFLGRIQKLSINFVSMKLGSFKNEYDREDENAPLKINNMGYAFGDYEEGSIHMSLTESLTASCPGKTEKWRIIITLKPRNLDGVIGMIPGHTLNNYLMMFMERGRLKLIFQQNLVHRFVESNEYIAMEEWIEITIVKDYVDIYFQINGNEKNHLQSIPNNNIKCLRNLIIGAIPHEIKENICPQCVKQSGMDFVLGSLNIDGKQFDLHSLPVQEVTSKRYSSRTISFSGSYQEIAIPLGQELKLSCFYDRKIHELNFQPLNDIVWLFIDKPLNRNIKNENNWDDLQTDGRISDLRIASYPTRDAIEGFYSCRLKYSDGILNTFGVYIITENEELENIPWEKWMLINTAIMINLGLLIFWSLCEGSWDILNGFGFYRLPHKTKISKMNSMLYFIRSKEGNNLIGDTEILDDIVNQVLKNR